MGQFSVAEVGQFYIAANTLNLSMENESVITYQVYQRHYQMNRNISITFKLNAPISTEQFIDLLQQSTLAQRRPIDDYQCMKGMVTNSNLTFTAWDDQKLIGIARSMTDFHYACYLSDLAVDKKYQKLGIGKALLIHTQQQLGEKCNLILIAAPSANSYYEHIGFSNNPHCWILGWNEHIT